MDVYLKELKKITGKIRNFGIDRTLTKENMSADAKAVGDEIRTLKDNQDMLSTTIGHIDSKNLLENTMTSFEVSGITYTVNDDKSITLYGTATDNRVFSINSSLVLDKGKYIFSGFPFMSGNETSCLRISLPDDYGYLGYGIDSLEFEIYEKTTCKVELVITKGTICNNEVVKPMIRVASNEDDTYEPYGYVRSIKVQIDEIKDAGKSVENDIKSVENELKNVKTTIVPKQLIPYPYTYKTLTMQGVQYTVSSDGRIVLHGAVSNDYECSSYPIFVASSHPLELKAGTYILNGVPKDTNGNIRLDLYSDSSEDKYNCNNRLIDYGEGVEFTIEKDTKFNLYIVVEDGYEYFGCEVKPMIRYASVTDDTFEPYKPSIASRFFVSKSNISTKETFELTGTSTCLLIISTDTNSDLYIATKYEESMSHLTRLTNNIDDVAVTMSSDGTVTMVPDYRFYSYFKILI